MAVYALGAKPKMPSEEIIQAAIDEGAVDSDGRLFEIIEVIAVENYANHTSTHGYQDTFVEKAGKGFKITHRKPGRIRWMQGKYGGKPRGQLAKTPFNVRVLALNYFDKKFKIKDPLQDAEIRAIAEKEYEKYTAEQKEVERKRIEGLDAAPDGGKIRIDGKTKDEIFLEEERKALKRREREIDTKSAIIEKKEKELGGKIETAVKSGVVITKYVEGELRNLQFMELRRVAKEVGIEVKTTDKKEFLISEILKKQNPEQTVTG